MTRAYDNAADGRYQQGGRRNLIINGNFDVWQRGTSFSNPDGLYTADRFKVVSGGATTGDSVSQQSFTVGQTDVPGEPEYYLRFSAGSTSSNKVMHHRIEDVRTGAGQTCTLSFWAKASVAHSSTVEVAQNFGSGGSTQVALSAQSYSMTTSWQKFTFSFAMPSISGKTIGTSSYVYIAFIRSLPASNVDIDIAQMQFELGNVATPFEHRSYGEELALCQRYYFKQTVSQANDSFFVGMMESPATSCFGDIKFIVPMRSDPSALETSGTATDYEIRVPGSTITCSAVPEFIRASEYSCLVKFNISSGGTIGNAGQCRAATTSGYLAWSAEL